MKTIGIIILATNIYFVLGLRFIKRFMYHYKGESKINFYIFSDTCVIDYIPSNFKNVFYYYASNSNWVDGTDSKFKNIISIETDLQKCDYIYYFDADTNVYTNFDESLFIGTTVAGEHYNNSFEQEKPYDRNIKSKAYVPRDTKLNQIYFYGAFFGGTTDKVIKYVKIFRQWQLDDKKINYEPCWNDESYINKYFHYNEPTLIVKCIDMGRIFDISCKGGIPDTRNTKNKIPNDWFDILKKNKNKTFNIVNNKLMIRDEIITPV